MSDKTSPLYGQVVGYVEWGLTVIFVSNPATPYLGVTTTKYWVSGPDSGATYKYKVFKDTKPTPISQMSLGWGITTPTAGYAPPAAVITYYIGLGIPLK